MIKPVYFVVTPDGVHDYMTVAKSQKEAAKKMGMSLYYCRLHGLRRLTSAGGYDEDILIAIANSEPDRVWKNKRVYGPDGLEKTPWVFAEVPNDGPKEAQN